jgi:hypothetical protein
VIDILQDIRLIFLSIACAIAEPGAGYPAGYLGYPAGYLANIHYL